MEKYTAPGGPSLALKEDILFLEIVYFYIFGGEAKLRWAAARSTPFGLPMGPKRQMRAAIYRQCKVFFIPFVVF
jgi:hypothetical protein